MYISKNGLYKFHFHLSPPCHCLQSYCPQLLLQIAVQFEKVRLGCAQSSDHDQVTGSLPTDLLPFITLVLPSFLLPFLSQFLAFVPFSSLITFRHPFMYIPITVFVFVHLPAPLPFLSLHSFSLSFLSLSLPSLTSSPMMEAPCTQISSRHAQDQGSRETKHYQPVLRACVLIGNGQPRPRSLSLYQSLGSHNFLYLYIFFVYLLHCVYLDIFVYPSL